MLEALKFVNIERCFRIHAKKSCTVAASARPGWPGCEPDPRLAMFKWIDIKFSL